MKVIVKVRNTNTNSNSNSNTKLKPLKHQNEILQELDMKDTTRNLIVLPSGAGKTHTLAFDVKRKNPKSFLYVVHRNEILEQTISTFKDVMGLEDNQIGRIIGSIRNRRQRQRELFRPYLFGTIQTISEPMNIKWMPTEIEYLCIDEYHHAAADTYQKLLNHFKEIKYFVGLSATPYRLDNKDIMSFVDYNMVGNIDLLTGIERGILVPFHYIGLLDNVDYSNIRYEHHRYYERDLDKVLLIDERDNAIIDQYRQKIASQNNGDNLTIGFCNSVKHVERMVDKFNKEGIKAAGISYADDIETRKKVLDDFRQNRIKILFTRDILNEGVDFPECNSIMLLRPTISKTVFFQQIGRGLRKFPDKKRVLILDFIGNYVNAFEKREWLEPFFSSTGSRMGVHKPEYNYEPSNTVEFDERVISLFELQKEALKGWTEQDLIKNYYDTLNNIKKDGELDKRKFKGVSIRDIKDRRYSRISVRPYLNRWGSWNNFVDYIEEKKNKLTPRKYGLETLKEKKYYLKKEKGLNFRQVLTRAEFESRYAYLGAKEINKIGGWEGYLKKIGEKKINKCPVCDTEFETSITRPIMYCSPKCDASQYYKRKREKYAINVVQNGPQMFDKICNNPECRKKFEVPRKYIIRRYCSEQCKRKYENKVHRERYYGRNSKSKSKKNNL